MTIKVIRSRDLLLREIQICKDREEKVAFVPTMGALHEGHISLLRRARTLADFTVVSIFVNPTQFAPHEDFSSYPRTEDHDINLLRLEHANIVFLPTVQDIYPEGTHSYVRPGPAAFGLETDFRPQFFDGVVNVVSRLFDLVKPDLAVFGEKDYQQLCVIREIVETLKLPIQIVGVPTIRDIFGLALSSRNAYLTEPELLIARRLNVILFEAASRIKQGEDTTKIINDTQHALLNEGFSKCDYVSLRWERLLAAVWLGKTRLIDNVACC